VDKQAKRSGAAAENACAAAIPQLGAGAGWRKPDVQDVPAQTAAHRDRGTLRVYLAAIGKILFKINYL
jgi:hypothetical protein